MTEQSTPKSESHVILLPATRRDGEATCAFLERQGLECQICANAGEAADALSETAGVLILTDVALNDPMVPAITKALSQQPDWSDVPVVLLSKAGTESLEVA